MGGTALAINPNYGAICDGRNSETIVEYQTFGGADVNTSFVNNQAIDSKVSLKRNIVSNEFRSTESILDEINDKIDQLNRKFEGIKKEIVKEMKPPQSTD
jgi:hypothetical protein